jgi:hypothetical protein
MFICANDGGAKQTVVRILDQLGWEAEDRADARVQAFEVTGAPVSVCCET